MAVTKTPAQKPPASSLTVVERNDGTWAFSLKIKGVVYPAQGNFPSRQKAEMVGFSTLNAALNPKT
ncbi:MAG: hypothetical protein ACOH2J_02770 [Allorhizobium sp.]